MTTGKEGEQQRTCVILYIQTIKDNFSSDLEAIAKGQLDDWIGNPYK